MINIEEEKRMKRRKVIHRFNGGFFGLLLVLYLFVYTYINKIPSDMSYMNPLIAIIIALFFGTPMKATYDILINIYFDFEEDIPKPFKKSRIMIHSYIDFISIIFALIIIIKFVNDLTIILASTVFFIVFLILGGYLYFSKKSLYKNTKK